MRRNEKWQEEKKRKQKSNVKNDWESKRGVGKNDRNGKIVKVKERSKEGRIQNMKKEQQEKEESKRMVKEKEINLCEEQINIYPSRNDNIP